MLSSILGHMFEAPGVYVLRRFTHLAHILSSTEVTDKLIPQIVLPAVCRIDLTCQDLDLNWPRVVHNDLLVSFSKLKEVEFTKMTVS